MNKKDKKLEYISVPTYIEKAVKKLLKLKSNEKELMLQLKDYMLTHDISLDTPLHLLKYIPEDEVDPNQMKMNFETGKVEKNEKRYLSSIIKTFKNRIVCIELTNENCSCNGDVYINIEIDSGTDGIRLPVFKYGTMYKNMKFGREYTLKELGLD